jgi:flagellar biosynthesis protein FlhF
MRLKTYTGPVMNDIMSQIKRDLGQDAIIVSSRTMDDGSLRVTAALDDEPVVEEVETLVDGVDDPALLFGGIRDYGALPDPDMDNRLDRISRALMWHHVPSGLHEKIMTHAEQSQGKTPRSILSDALSSLFRFHPLTADRYETPIMLVGQPGAGKTTTIAKLAARAAMEELNVAVITADTHRAGGVEQLAAFTKLLKIELAKVSTPDQLKKALRDASSADQVFIDCPGVNAFDPASMKELFSFAKAAHIEIVITLSAGMDADESADVARAFAVLGARGIIPTRLDMTRRLGGILSGAEQAGLAFVGMGNKPDIADGFVPLDAVRLAALLLPSEEK